MSIPPTASDTLFRIATHEEIACRANELWELEGRIHGNNEKHWHEAVHQVQGTPPGDHGNPANPSLTEREKIVDDHIGKEEPVKKIRAEALKKTPPVHPVSAKATAYNAAAAHDGSSKRRPRA